MFIIAAQLKLKYKEIKHNVYRFYTEIDKIFPHSFKIHVCRKILYVHILMTRHLYISIAPNFIDSAQS